MTPLHLFQARAIAVRLSLLMVADDWGVSLRQFAGQDRRERISRARRDAYAALRALGMTLPQIGAELGGRDHSTVLAGLAKREAEMLATARDLRGAA